MDLAAKTFAKRAAADGTTVLMLSLKLILLAFFILLTTMSNFEERRSREVLESVALTFQGRVAALRTLPNPDAGLGALDGANSLATRLESLFKRTLPAVKVEKAADGTVLRIELPARSLFRRERAELALGRGPLLRRLADALTGEAGRARFYELQFLHARPRGAATPRDDLGVLRAGLFARHMAELGLAESDISVGLWPVAADGSKAGMVAIVIRLRESPVSTAPLAPEDAGAQ